MPSAATTMPDFTGCVVERRWQLLRMIGTGSYGVVYESHDLHPRTPLRGRCAIKIINKTGRTPEQVQNMYEEIRLHRLVSYHPNIVTIHHAFEEGEYLFLVLGLCRGGDLFDRLCRKRTYKGNNALIRKAFLSLIEALRTCHERKVFHRDLKPENILTNEDGSQLYLTDFGLATDRTLVHNHGVGTGIYMSPECVGRMTAYKPYCSRFSDMWSLGVILVNMLSGQHPWALATLEDCCFSQFVEDPHFFKRRLPITDGANDILLRLLALNPLQRISLDELRKAVLSLDAFFLSAEQLSGEEDGYYNALVFPCMSNGESMKGVILCACEIPGEEVDIGDLCATVRMENHCPAAAQWLAKPCSTAVNFALRPAKFTQDNESDSEDDSDGSSNSARSAENPYGGLCYQEKDIAECFLEENGLHHNLRT